MAVVTDRQDGLFPSPKEISFKCSCPDWAVMCKHVAAVLYGVGARLDTKPELLFLLRGVNHEELIEADAEAAVAGATARGKSKRLAAADLSDVFGIEIEAGDADARRLILRKTKDAQPRRRRPAFRQRHRSANRSPPSVFAGEECVPLRLCRRTGGRPPAALPRKKQPQREGPPSGGVIGFVQ